MSQKDIDSIRQKVFYIDNYVNTFFNTTLINIQKNVNELNIRLAELEKKSNNNDVNNEVNNLSDEKPKKIEKKQSKANNRNNLNSNNQIRTISLQ